MEIPKSQMSKNIYNRTDAAAWMTAKTLKKTTFLDTGSLELYDKSFLTGLEEEDTEIDFQALYRAKQGQFSYTNEP